MRRGGACSIVSAMNLTATSKETLMTIRTTLRLLCTAAFLAIAACGAYAATARAADQGTLTISFVDGNGGKVAGACVELLTEVGGDFGEQVETICDTDGSAVRPLPHGRYV